MGASVYNLSHGQVAPKAPSPVFVDIPKIRTLEAGVDQDSDKLSGDGGIFATGYGARTGTGSGEVARIDLASFATLSGQEFSTTGTGATKIDRLEVASEGSPPATILSGYASNVDGTQTAAGFRITIGNATSQLPSGPLDQETWGNFGFDFAFDPDDNGNLLIYEILATAPTLTAGVYAVNINPPA
jgi:hypothetical protein